jgi:hypothetical protein
VAEQMHRDLEDEARQEHERAARLSRPLVLPEMAVNDPYW